MKITYIFRAQSKERSIERVFVPIMKRMEQRGFSVSNSFAWSFHLWPLAMIANILRYSIMSYCGGFFHITGDVQYVACLMNPRKTIMTIHDCVSLHNDNVPAWIKKFVKKFWYEKPLKRLKIATCISEATRTDIISFFPWAANKLVVVPNPVGEEFKYTPKEFNDSCPQILHVGTRDNKNLGRVIEALDGIKCRLDIIGKLSSEQERLLLQHKIDYRNRYQVPDHEILKAYQSADIISFPSLFEGFGLPIIEGQTIGRPVLTSNREPMKSVAGEGSCLVNPESVESIREGFEKLICESIFRDRVIDAGIENSRRFYISNVVEAYLTSYDKLVKA